MLLGTSGSGKTTALKTMNGLVRPDQGEVRVLGEDVTRCDVVALRRRIGYVIQEGGLLPHLSVLDNVVLVPRLLGWPLAERRGPRDGAAAPRAAGRGPRARRPGRGAKPRGGYTRPFREGETMARGDWTRGPVDAGGPPIQLRLPPVPRIPPATLRAVAAVVVALVLVLSSYYQVEPDEVGVVQRFGSYVRTTDPGPHLKFPFGRA